MCFVEGKIACGTSGVEGELKVSELMRVWNECRLVFYRESGVAGHRRWFQEKHNSGGR